MDNIKASFVTNLQPLIRWIFDNYQNNQIKPLDYLYMTSFIVAIMEGTTSLIFFIFAFIGLTLGKDNVKKLQALLIVLSVSIFKITCTETIHAVSILTLWFIAIIMIILSIVIQFMLSYITGARADISKHIYTPVKHYYKGKLCGEILYINHLPILKFYSDNSTENGYTHGFLLAKQIKELKEKIDFLKILTKPFGLFVSTTSKPFYDLIDKIPTTLINEINGLVHGYNEYWTSKNVKFAKLTFQDVLDWQTMADSKHFNPTKLDKLSMACTAILKNQYFGRNMDWSGIGRGGEYSLLMVWENEGVASYSVPGILGCITGWNKSGVCVSINVCPGETKEIRGMPITLFIRHMLKNVKTITDVRQKFTSEDYTSYRPLGPCHLTISQSGKHCSGIIISYCQGENDWMDFIREQKEGQPLYALNWREPDQIGGFFNSEKRHKWLQKYKLQNNENKNDKDYIRNILSSSPLFNCWMTIHSFVFDLNENTVEIRNNNGFAMSNTVVHYITLGEVFTRK